ncbi:MAG: EAL domain-containing protein, partial [Eubacteriales bacterium]|nr:EAL domain-containing protein [Eubacteriales bacterium]
SLGAADYFVKPFNVNLLRLRMEAVIRLRESTVMIDEIEYDPVTGTLTKVAFMHHAKSLLREYPDATFDLCVFELEDMDILNEQYGMTRVDELVRYISDTLKASNTAQSVLGRLSARRFVGLDLHQEISDTRVSMYVKDMADNAPIPDIMIKAALYENIEHDISLSVAINQTLRAMETIRHQYGKYAAIFDRTVRLQMEREQMIEACMAEALEEKQFEVYYQPKHSAETGELVGAEALIRWNHPLYGFMSPGEFIPLFEKNGFISKVDAFVSQEVIANMTSWIKRGIKIPSVSINVSRVDLPQISDVGSYAVNLGKYGLTPDNIHIEITESMYVANQSRQIQIISDLRDQGFVIEMDDFGAGYSSLGLLKTLPLDIIKLDMTFVRNLDKQMEVVRAMIELAHSLGKTVIAEGVETEEQFSILRMFGCDAVQGYYFSKPLPKAGFEAYMIAQEERLQKERAAALVSDKAADLMEALKSQAYQVDMLNSAADTLDIKFSEADFNIRTAYEALKRLKDLFDVVRLVDATQKVEYRMDDDGHIRKGEHHCFEIWRRNGECQNCISAKALQTKGKYSKRENIGRDNYMVISKYVEINHVPFALELVTKLE